MSEKQKDHLGRGGQSAGLGNARLNEGMDYLHHITTHAPCQQQKTSNIRLDTSHKALIRLDAVERRLQAARIAGDDLTWVRFYLAWLALHSFAFGYREGGERCLTAK